MPKRCSTRWNKTIVPLYYDVDTRTGISAGWMRMVKESIRTLAPMFSTARMLKEYTTEMYVPAALGETSQRLSSNAVGRDTTEALGPRSSSVRLCDTVSPCLLFEGDDHATSTCHWFGRARHQSAAHARAAAHHGCARPDHDQSPAAWRATSPRTLARLGVPIVFAGIMGDDPQARLLIELSRAAGLRRSASRPIGSRARRSGSPQTAGCASDGDAQCGPRRRWPPDRRSVQRRYSRCAAAA